MAPGDTLDALHARRAFFDAGHYHPIAHAAAAAVGSPDGVVLDAGCGEGYYLTHLAAERRMGCDVAKAGVRMAAKRDAGALFFVGSSFRLPVLPGSLAAVLTVFAPRPNEEFARVLAPGGRVVAVTPALRHLEELRAAAGQAEAPSRRDVPPPGASSFTRVTYPLELAPDHAALLLAMTPIAGYAPASTELPTRISVDVWVATYLNS